MLRISLIGAGDIKYHYLELLKISESEFNKHLTDIAKVLVDSEMVLLPDRGVCFELAKKYREAGGKKVIGTVPLSDKDFGIKHLELQRSAEVDGKKLFDEEFDTGTWYKQDLTICTFGDVVLFLGKSLGAVGELVNGYYLYKLFQGDKPEVKAVKKKIHPELRAGENIPFSVIVYNPFVKDKLAIEIESYIRKLGGEIYYVNNADELKEVITKINY